MPGVEFRKGWVRGRRRRRRPQLGLPSLPHTVGHGRQRNRYAVIAVGHSSQPGYFPYDDYFP